jgi:hypothetical protein
MSAINHTLAAASDFFQQFVIAEVAKYFSPSRGFLFFVCSNAIFVAGVDDPGYRFVREQTKTTLQETSGANFSGCLRRDFCSASSTNAG